MTHFHEDDMLESAVKNVMDQPIQVGQYEEYLMRLISQASHRLGELRSTDYATAYLNGIGFAMVNNKLNQSAIQGVKQ